MVIAGRRARNRNFVLKFNQTINQSFGARRATGNVDIHGHHAVNTLQNAVTIRFDSPPDDVVTAAGETAVSVGTGGAGMSVGVWLTVI